MTFLERYLELKKQGRLHELQALIPYAGVVGFETETDEKGLVTVLRQKDSNIGNTQIPAVHGGVVGAHLEHAALMAVMWEQDLTAFPKIVNVSIDYLRPVIGTKDTYARGALIKQGRTVSNVRVQAWQDDENKPVAAAHCHILTG